MTTLVIILHVIVCLAMILVVLLQTGKGADMGAAFGGGSSQTLFGSSGAGGFMTKLTTGAAIFFMCTSLTLAYLHARPATKSVMDTAPVTAPAALPSEPVVPDSSSAAQPAAEATEAAPASEAPAAPADPVPAGDESAQ